MTENDNVIRMPFMAQAPKVIKLVFGSDEFELFVKDYEFEHIGPTTEVSIVLTTCHLDKEAREKLAVSLCQSTLPSELE